MNYYTGNVQLDNVCRLCLANEPNNINVFGDIGQRYNLQAKVWKQFNIWVRPDETFPKGVCKTCLTQVETFHIYSLKVEAVQQKLVQILSTNQNLVSPRFEDFYGNLEFNNPKSGEISQSSLFNTETSYPTWDNLVSRPKKVADSIECIQPTPENSPDTLVSTSNFEQASTEIKVEVDPAALLKNCSDQSNFLSEFEDRQLLNNKTSQKYTFNYSEMPVESVPGKTRSGVAKILNNRTTIKSTNDDSEMFSESSNSSAEGLNDDEFSHSRNTSSRLSSTDNSDDSQSNILEKTPSCSSSKTIPEEFIEHPFRWSKKRPFTKERLERSKKSQKIKEQLDNFFDYVCNDCEEKTKFSNFLLLRNHCRDAHNKKAYVTCCKRRLTDRKALIHHMLTQHLQPDEFSCPQCGKSVSTQHMLKLHIINHLPESERPYKCSQCGKGFCSIAYVRKHEKSHHFADEPLGSFMCDECGKSFVYERKLIVHKRNLHTVVENPVMCHICAKTFKHQSALRSHLMTHKEGRTEECPHCHKFFKNTDTVRSHIKQEHRVTPAQCTQCDKTFRSKRKLVCHTKVFHSDEKPYPCKMCQKRFKLKSGLKTHIVQHTGEKPFQCPYCPRTFASSGNWSTHKKRMHGEVKAVSSYVPQMPNE